MAFDEVPSDAMPANALLFEGVTRFSESTWTPNTDVFLEEGELVIQVEVAGLRLEDLSVRVDGTKLLFSGKRSIRKQNARRKFILMEINSGNFRFTIDLPKAYDAHHARSNFVNGILRIEIPPVSQASDDLPLQS